MMRIWDQLPAIIELAWADFKLKYQGSAFGLLWTLLKPFLMLVTLYVVFKYFLGVGIENFHLYILFGVIIWNFFADCMQDTMMSLKSKSNILKSTSIAPSLIVFSATLHSFLTFLINVAIFLVIYLVSGLGMHPFMLGMIPLSVLFFGFVYGASLLLSYLYLRVDDMDHIWDVASQLLFWMTPVVYSLEGCVLA
jgi:ABC-2 type transport system permease protein